MGMIVSYRDIKVAIAVNVARGSVGNCGIYGDLRAMVRDTNTWSITLSPLGHS